MDLSRAIFSHRLFSERRLPSLYSDFRSLKEKNPDGYEANVAAWNAVLTQAVRKGLLVSTNLSDSLTEENSEHGEANITMPDLLVIHSGRALLDSLTSPVWGSPLGLQVVFVWIS